MLVAREHELATVDDLLEHGGTLVVEAGPGLGKTALLQECAARSRRRGMRDLLAQGSELEAGFVFGVVRQLLERELSALPETDRATVLGGPAAVAGELLLGSGGTAHGPDRSFALLHGLYWLTANLATYHGPLLIAVDDAQWADSASMRWLGFLARRLRGLPVAVLVTLRPAEVAGADRLVSELRSAARLLRPALLDPLAAALLARDALGADLSGERCLALWRSSGGNPFYLGELIRAERLGLAAGHAGTEAGHEVITAHVGARVRRLDRAAALLAGAVAVLGDGCPLRQAAAVAGIDMDTAGRLAAGLVDAEVFAAGDPPRFLHPIVRAAIEASLPTDGRRRLHRAAARALAEDHAPPGRVAAQLMMVSPAGDPWALARLRDAARVASVAGAPDEAGALLRRALAEPPAPAERVGVLRELAAAEVSAGRATAVDRVEQALSLSDDPRTRAQIAFEVAQIHAALFRWTDAVDVLDRALGELGGRDPTLRAVLESELVVAGMHDSRRAHRVVATLDQLAASGAPAVGAEALAVARGMAMALTGRADAAVTTAMEAALLTGDLGSNWDTRAALLWTLIILERLDSVRAALPPMIDSARSDGSARGLIAVYSSLGLLKFRLGELAEADAAARIALRVLRSGDFTPGLGVGAIVADVATESGDLAAGQAVLAATPVGPPGVISVLVPAARGRLQLARGEGEPAARSFDTCLSMLSREVWGIEIRDVGYLDARCGAAQAQLLLGDRGAARELADAGLADARDSGRPRALGVALRVAGLAHGGPAGVDLLEESVCILRQSPAMLERAKSSTELGAALRRRGSRTAARRMLADGLDLAAACGAGPLADRARSELRAAGARPRRDRRRGLDALTPGELRVAGLAADGLTNRQIAQTLYLTAKTVETHLGRTYAKLGISTRSELPKALGRPGSSGCPP